jgi:hypothetical protein
MGRESLEKSEIMSTSRGRLWCGLLRQISTLASSLAFLASKGRLQGRSGLTPASQKLYRDARQSRNHSRFNGTLCARSLYTATRALRRLTGSDTVSEQDSNGNFATKFLQIFAAQSRSITQCSPMGSSTIDTRLSIGAKLEKDLSAAI